MKLPSFVNNILCTVYGHQYPKTAKRASVYDNTVVIYQYCPRCDKTLNNPMPRKIGDTITALVLVGVGAVIVGFILGAWLL